MTSSNSITLGGLSPYLLSWIRTPSIISTLVSNSKLLTSFLEWNSACTFSGFQKASLHGLVIQQISGLFFRLNLAPQFDRHDDCRRIATFVRDVLNVRHRLI